MADTMKPKEIITNSLKYYDNIREQQDKHTKRFRYFSIEISKSDLEYNKVLFYDQNKNLIISTDYEILGVYFAETLLWVWSWAMPTHKQNIISTARKILNYGLDMIPTDQDMFLRAELITSRFKMTNQLQLDIHLALASYLTKGGFIYRVIINKETFRSVGGQGQMIEISTDDSQGIFYYLCLLNPDIEKN